MIWWWVLGIWTGWWLHVIYVGLRRIFSALAELGDAAAEVSS